MNIESIFTRERYDSNIRIWSFFPLNQLSGSTVVLWSNIFQMYALDPENLTRKVWPPNGQNALRTMSHARVTPATAVSVDSARQSAALASSQLVLNCLEWVI